MRSKIYLFVTTLIVVMCSCNPKSSGVDYLPCQVDEDEGWGFVNAKGEVFCRGRFSEYPSEVRDGIFFIEENDAYSMYQFDAKEPRLLLENISSYGKISEGVVPICKKDCRIEIVNAQGVTQFVVDKINGQEVKSCASTFKSGCLLVLTLNSDGNSYYGVIDKSGKVVLPPMYNDLYILGKDLFFARYKNNGEEIVGIIDINGKNIARWDDDIDVKYISDKYIVTEVLDRFYILDLTGKEVLKCPSKVKDIEDCKDDFFVFHDGSDYGVMNIKGEVILPTKYLNIEIVNDVFVAQKRESENKNLHVFNKKGEQVAEIEEDKYAQEIKYVDKFGYIMTGGYDYVLDNTFRPINNLEFEAIRISEEYEDVLSEYFDPITVVEAVKQALNSDFKDIKFNTPITQIERITKNGTWGIGGKSNSVSIIFNQGVKYSIKAFFLFDNYVLTPIYVEKKVKHEDWFWGTSYTTEKVIDGYNFNSEALLKKITIECSVPNSRKEEVYNELFTFINEYAEYDPFGILVKEDRQYYLKDVSIEIEPYEGSESDYSTFIEE